MGLTEASIFVCPNSGSRLMKTFCYRLFKMRSWLVLFKSENEEICTEKYRQFKTICTHWLILLNFACQRDKKVSKIFVDILFCVWNSAMEKIFLLAVTYPVLCGAQQSHASNTPQNRITEHALLGEHLCMELLCKYFRQMVKILHSSNTNCSFCYIQS